MPETDVVMLTAGFLAASARAATPLLWAALGEMVTERSGVINLGVEGAMLTGALAGAIGGLAGGPWLGLAAAMAAGGVVSLLFSLVAIVARADQIITGTAVTLGAIGVTGLVARRVFGPEGPGLDLPRFASLPLPFLDRIPILGEGLFSQAIVFPLGAVVAVLLTWALFRTRWGLALRAVGEEPTAAQAAGVPVRATRLVATVLGGMAAGIGGGSLVLANVGTFTEEMTAGRGFIAIAIVVLGRWHPLGVLIAAFLFGMASAMQFLFQALGLGVPYQIFLMLPYLLALAALAGAVGRTRAPAALGKGGEKDEV